MQFSNSAVQILKEEKKLENESFVDRVCCTLQYSIVICQIPHLWWSGWAQTWHQSLYWCKYFLSLPLPALTNPSMSINRQQSMESKTLAMQSTVSLNGSTTLWTLWSPWNQRSNVVIAWATQDWSAKPKRPFVTWNSLDQLWSEQEAWYPVC